MDNKIYNIIYNKIYTTFASQRARNDLEEKNLQNMAFICFVSDEIRLYLGNNLGKNFLFLLCVCVCMFASTHVWVCMHIVFLVLKLILGIFLNFSPLLLLRQGLSLNLHLTSSVSPATQLASGILCFCILSTGVEGHCHACLTVRQILGI